MKNIAFALILLSLCSCSSSTYYQVFQVTPDEEMSITPKVIIYEDDNCSLYYDMWSFGGDAGFWFINTSEKDICINLNECFFIRNDVANDYYQNRLFSNSTREDVSISKSSAVVNRYSFAYGKTHVTSTTNNHGVTWQEKISPL